MKILLYSDFFLSGQTTHVLELAKQLQKLEVQVHLAFDTVHSNLFWSHYIPYLKKHQISFSVGANLPSLTSFDLIHAQSSTLFQKSQRLASHRNIPYVFTCHGLGFNHPRYYQVLNDADAIIAIGPKVALELRHFSTKVITIRNGIDTEFFRPPQNFKQRSEIIYIGRLDRKRLWALQQLIQNLEKSSQLPLKLISDYNPNLKGTIYVPWQVNPLPTLQQAGIVVACGRTAREALSCSNVVFLMQQGYDGVISPKLVAKANFDFSGNLARFPFSQLEQDFNNLLQKPSRLRKLQKWGRKYAEQHLSSKVMAKQTLQLYNEVLGRNYSEATKSSWPP